MSIQKADTQMGICFCGTPKGTRNTKESLGQALASGAHPRRNLWFSSIMV